MIFDVFALVVEGCVGLLLAGAGVVGVVVSRRVRARGRRARAGVLAEVQVEAWRVERRARRAAELRAWQGDFDALLPRPAPVPCDGSGHAHIDDTRFGDREVRVVCVPYRPAVVQGYAAGMISAAEAVEALQRLVTPVHMLSRGERVLSADEIESIGAQAAARTRRGW